MEFLGLLGLKSSPSIPTIVESIIDCVVSGLVSLLGVLVTKDRRFFFSFVILILLFLPVMYWKRQTNQIIHILKFFIQKQKF